MIYYTDGSTRPTNPGPESGFGVVILDDNENLIDTYYKHYSGEMHTNNEMEMKAILWAVCHAIKNGETPIIYSDSAYAINSFTVWSHGWEKNGWLKGDGQPPQNLKLVKTFYDLNKLYQIFLRKVKGHQDNKWNNLADELACKKEDKNEH